MIVVGFIGFSIGYSYMRPAPDAYDIYNGPEVQDERAHGSEYVESNRDDINSRDDMNLVQPSSEFNIGDDSDKLFMSYDKQS